MFEYLAELFGKDINGLHIHKCINTNGNIICWPEKVNSEYDAIEVLKKWSGMIGALLVSQDIGDINGFYEKYKDADGDWGDNAIRESGVEIIV